MPQDQAAPRGHDAEEAHRIATAAYFVRIRAVTGGMERQEHPTLASAVEAAGADPRTVIYAISASNLTWPLSKSSWSKGRG